jgi:hypothetical protein
LKVSKIHVNKNTGQIEFTATGSGTVHVIYKNTVIQKLSGAVSLIGFILFFVYLIILKRRVARSDYEVSKV